MRVPLVLCIGLTLLVTSAAAQVPSLTRSSLALSEAPQIEKLTVSGGFTTATPTRTFPLGPDPTEPLVPPYTTYARVKSPQQQMHFTAGLPFRFLADGRDQYQYMCPPGHPPYACTDVQMEFFIDGVSVGIQHQTDVTVQTHGWEVDLQNGLTVGDHVLTVRYTPHNQTNARGTPVNGLVPVTIHVDPLPTHANMVNLTADLVLSGSRALNWSNTTVIGNGHTVTSAAGYRGIISITNSFLTGLGAYDGYSLDVATTGSVDLESSVFEATAPVRVNLSGKGTLTVKGNEFRANNLITYVPSDPMRSPILDLTGATTGAKLIAGNNIAGGILSITGGRGWQVGGATDAASNILLGPRAVVNYINVAGATHQLNYDHHTYDGGWSQGFNLYVQGSSGLLAENNVIRGGSWLVQSFCGEYRYNLSIDDAGHDTWRGLCDAAKIHHSLFLYASVPNTGYNGLLVAYSGGKNAEVYNNTFDAGGAASVYTAPALMLHTGSVFKSVRSNVFIGFSNANSGLPAGIVAADDANSLLSADYNDFYNPLATRTPPYSTGLVAPGGHDKSADPLFAGKPDIPYRVDEGMIWTRQYTVSQVLEYYRRLYTPSAGSPLIDAGDPDDGVGNDIGAVSIATPPTPTPTPTVTHPRIWLDATRMALLRRKVTGKDASWRAFKAKADTLATYSVRAYDRNACGPNEICYTYQGGGWMDAVSALGLAYQVTHDTRYSAKVLQIVDVMTAAGTAPEQVDSGFPSRSAALALDLAFDWCYDQLGDTRKAAIIATLNGYYDWAKANAFDFSSTSSAVGNYFGGHLLGFGLAGLATTGDNARASEVTAYVRGLYDAVITPAFASGYLQSGYPIEAYVYGTNHFVRLLQYMVAVKTATGEDLVGPNAAKIAHNLLYSLKPNRWQFPDEADYAGSYTGIMDPTLIAMLPTLMPAGAPDATYAQWQYQHLAPNPAGLQPADPAALFLWYDPSLPATDYRTVLPLSWYSPGDEHLFTRTSWADDAVWMSFRALNAMPSGHQLRGAGNIEVQRGTDYLLVNAGQWKGPQGWGGSPEVFDGRSKEANTLKYKNPWRADYDGGQGAWGVNQTLAHAETPTFAFLIADLTSPYTNRIPTGLKAFRRAFVSLQDGNAVVCDHVEAGAATDLHTLLWHLNPATVPIVNGQIVTTRVGESKLQIATFGEQPVAVTLARDQLSDADTTPTTYRVEVNDTSGSTTLNVLTVLSAFASTGAAPAIRLLEPMAVQVGSRSVTCGPGARSVTVK